MNKKIKIGGIVAGVLIILGVGLNFAEKYIVNKKLQEAEIALKDENFNISYDKYDGNIFNKNITIKNVTMSSKDLMGVEFFVEEISSNKGTLLYYLMNDDGVPSFAEVEIKGLTLKNKMLFAQFGLPEDTAIDFKETLTYKKSKMYYSSSMKMKNFLDINFELDTADVTGFIKSLDKFSDENSDMDITEEEFDQFLEEFAKIKVNNLKVDITEAGVFDLIQKSPMFSDSIEDTISEINEDSFMNKEQKDIFTAFVKEPKNINITLLNNKGITSGEYFDGIDKQQLSSEMGINAQISLNGKKIILDQQQIDLYKTNYMSINSPMKGLAIFN